MTMERQMLHVFVPNRESRGRIALELVFTGPGEERAGLRLQPAALSDGESVLLIRAARPEAQAALRRLVGIGTHLVMSRAGGAYPAQLAQLIGHDTEMAIFGHAGRPLADIELSENEKREVARHLLVGVRALGDAHVTHRAIHPKSLFWDGSVLQIADFSAAAVVGSREAADEVNGAPWCSPEQAAALRPGTPADDIYSVALVLFWLYSGEEPDADPAVMRHRLRLQDPPLPALLAGCFEDDESRRPTLRRLQDRWMPPPPPLPPAQKRRADRARVAFRELRERQAAERAEMINPAEAPAPSPRATAFPPRAAAGARRPGSAARTQEQEDTRVVLISCGVILLGLVVVVFAVIGLVTVL